LTYPDFLRWRFGDATALLAAVISGLGYLGFSGAQILAGAKLASATVITSAPWNLDPLTFSLWVIATVTVLYTVVGGLKAVIYTDTIQWIILLCGLAIVVLRVLLGHELGGLPGMRSSLPAAYFSLGNIAPLTFVNWMVTIIPIWLVGMTLYQRMYACKDERAAKRAWYVAGFFEYPVMASGFFEYPVMAFMGVFLGMCARVAFPSAEAEMGLPLLIKNILPTGLVGLVTASYFSAIMSTADSCLMASSSNFVNDLLARHLPIRGSAASMVRLSRLVTLVVGAIAVVVASRFTKVLKAILFAYSFMVAGLFVPTLGAFFWPRANSTAAMTAMVLGGSWTLLQQLSLVSPPSWLLIEGLDPAAYGIALSAVSLILVSLITNGEAESHGR
ncbi:MAG: sodium:solute symporter family protein, partial [Deltaproteobacteria bacterium]|nr:sodium:solute symporter family protein [Deltaproteobacteria bacterium]